MSEPSFSAMVKAELDDIIPRARHCQIAELTALTIFSRLYGERRKYFTLLHKTGSISRYGTEDDSFLWQSCCKRAYLRGAFLSSGSVNAPTGAYHFEIGCPDDEAAAQLTAVMKGLELSPGLTGRKGISVVYLKEAESIVTVLGLMGASGAVLRFEDARVLKDMRGQVNRKVNCETANIGKTVDAGLKQIDAIHRIERTSGLSSLPDSLRELAELRLANPDMPLAALGELLTPPLGKSGVNHRLRRIVEIAEDL